MNHPFHTSEVPSVTSPECRFIMGHGWGQSGLAFRPLAEALQAIGASLLLDFPGFGASPLPSLDWGTAEYADATYQVLNDRHLAGTAVWIGHSFGGRIGLQLASRHPDALRGMVLIAAAGLKRKRGPIERARIGARRIFFRTARKLVRSEAGLERLRNRIGSADYRAAGPLRPILTRVVNEDLSQIATRVSCPTLLIYGTADTETPVEFGERFRSLIPNAQLAVLEGFGHLDILTDGRHQVAARIKRFVSTLIPSVATNP